MVLVFDFDLPKSPNKILSEKKTREVHFTGIHSSYLRCCSLEWPPIKCEARSRSVGIFRDC